MFGAWRAVVEGRGPPTKTFTLSPLFVKARPDTGHDRTGARTGSPKGGGAPPFETEAPEGGPRKASQTRRTGEREGCT